MESRQVRRAALRELAKGENLPVAKLRPIQPKGKDWRAIKKIIEVIDTPQKQWDGLKD